MKDKRFLIVLILVINVILWAHFAFDNFVRHDYFFGSRPYHLTLLKEQEYTVKGKCVDISPDVRRYLIGRRYQLLRRTCVGIIADEECSDESGSYAFFGREYFPVSIGDYVIITYVYEEYTNTKIIRNLTVIEE